MVKHNKLIKKHKAKKSAIKIEIDKKQDIIKSINDNTIPQAYTNNTLAIRISLIVCLILSLGILLGTIGFTMHRMNAREAYTNSIVAYNEIDAIVIVIPGIAGMNGDTDALKFGKVAPGGGGTRFIDINSTERVIVEIYFSGEMSKFLSVEKNQYIIEPNTVEHVPINLDIPYDTALGTYTGKVHVTLLRP